MKSTPKWLAVARNEYRTHTARVRWLRPYIPYLTIGLLLAHLLFIAPAVVALFVDEAMSLLLSRTAVATVQITFLTTFFLFMIMPMTETLREVRTGKLDILLAAPVKPSDLLLGEFLGELPFYAVLVALLAGIFTAILRPFGLGAAQIGMVTTAFVLTLVSAFWIGTVIAAILRTRLEKLAGGKDIGGAIAMILPLPVLAIAYAAWGGGLLEMLSSPSNVVAGTILSFLPSSWGARMVVDFASNPAHSSALALAALGRLAALACFFLSSLWLGAKAADRAYSLEQSSLSASTVKPEGIFYGTMRSLGGRGPFGTVLLTVFKDYWRTLQNISGIVYMLGIMFLINVFAMPTPDGAGGPPMQILPLLFLFPIVVIMVTGDVTVQGKENLFIYRKAPLGVERYLRAMLVKGWMLVVPLSGIVGALASLASASPLVTALFMMLIVAANVAFVIGLFLRNPAYSDKSPRLWMNIFIAMFVQIGAFTLSMIVLTKGGSLSQPIGGFPGLMGLLALTSWSVAAVFYGLGKARLERME